MKRLSLVLLVLFATASPVSAAPVDFPDADFSGYSSGAAIHVGALQAATNGPRLIDSEIAFSGAAVASLGFKAPIHDELQQAVLPTAKAGAKAYGRGTGLEVGTGTALPNDPNSHQVVLAGLAEAAAPPIPGMVEKELGPVQVPPLAYASLVRGQAQPVFGEETCVLGQPISYGLGYAADAQLLNGGETTPDGAFAQPVLAADAGEPIDRTVSQSKSFTYLVANGDGTYGLATETRQTLAPVTLFKGTPNELTVEVLGEFVFRAVATGKPGGARIDYAPDGSPTPTAPILRIIPAGDEPTELTFEEVFGKEGLVLPQNPLLALALGEDPRAIAAPGKAADPASAPAVAADGTSAAGAVDVVRVTLPDPAPADAPKALELRIGHMEARAAVPAGGIRCKLPVRKTTNPDVVQAGQAFTWTITIPPKPESLLGLACDLIGVSAIDTTSADPGVEYTLESASNGGVVDGKTVKWSNLGDYHPGDPPIVVTISGRVADTSAGGLLKDTVDVTAALGNCTGGAVGRQLVGLARVDTAAVAGVANLLGPEAEAVVRAAAAATPPAAPLPAPDPPAVPPGVLPRTGTDLHGRVLAPLVLLGPALLLLGMRRKHAG